MVVPIVQAGQVVGALGFEGKEWTTEEVALVEALSEQFAQAAENQRLIEETQERAARERLTGEVASRMRESLDVDAVLQTAAREMRRALRLHDISIRLEGVGELSEAAQAAGRDRIE
jgi:GAF domain-containing protein